MGRVWGWGITVIESWIRRKVGLGLGGDLFTILGVGGINQRGGMYEEECGLMWEMGKCSVKGCGGGRERGYGWLFGFLTGSILPKYGVVDRN